MLNSKDSSGCWCGARSASKRRLSSSTRASTTPSWCASCADNTERFREPMKALERFSPRVVRLLARRGIGRASRLMTTHEIAFSSGLSVRIVQRISRSNRWDEIRIGEAMAFMRACGFNPDATRRHAAYLRRGLDPSRTDRPFASARARPILPPRSSDHVLAAVGPRALAP